MITGEVRAEPVARLAFVDNLRTALTLLVVAHHVALVYGNLGFWPNWEPPPTPVAGLPLDAFVLFNQAFFMGFFFLLAGYVAPGAIDRRGVGAFVVQRWWRLGIPLIAYLVLVRPLFALPIYLDLPPAERGPYWVFFLTDPTIGPAWFLEVLLVFALGYALLRRVRPAPAEHAPVRLRAWHVVAFAVALGVVSYAWRIVAPVGTPVLGIPSPAHLPQYLVLFAVGVVAYRRGWLTALPARPVRLGVALIVVAFVPMALLGGYATLVADPAPAAGTLPHLGFALWDSLFAVGVIVLLLAVFQRHVTAAGPVARFLAENAFAVYLLHAPVIVAVAALFGPVGWEPAAKFAVVLVISAVVSWMLAALVRSVRAVRAVV